MSNQNPTKVEIFVGITEKLSEDNLINFSMTVNEVPVNFSDRGINDVRWSYPIIDGFFRNGVVKACSKGANFLLDFLELDQLETAPQVYNGKLLIAVDGGYRTLPCTKVDVDLKPEKIIHKKLKSNLFLRLAMRNLSKINSF